MSAPLSRERSYWVSRHFMTTVVIRRASLLCEVRPRRLVLSLEAWTLRPPVVKFISVAAVERP